MFRIRDLTPEARLRAAEFGLKDQLPARELFFRLLPENPEYGEARKLAKMLGVDGNVVYTWIKRSDRRRAFLQAAYERKAQALEAREEKARRRREKHERVIEVWKRKQARGRPITDTAARLRRRYGVEAVPYRNLKQARRWQEAKRLQLLKNAQREYEAACKNFKTQTYYERLEREKLRDKLERLQKPLPTVEQLKRRAAALRRQAERLEKMARG